MILAIAGFCLTASPASWAAHGGPVCRTCHYQAPEPYSAPARPPSAGVDGCVVCHRGYGRIFDHSMARRTGERQFVQRSYARVDSGFWDKNCSSCHLKSCLDCHDEGTAKLPTVATCQKCHKGYYTGWDYSGRAPREDNMRYQRGLAIDGETFLKMLPDVHYRAGMTCGACHSMKSLIQGSRASRDCIDCHTVDRRVVEHSIPAHLEKLECYACHSAWGAQEYGTFFLRFRDPSMKEDFDLKPGPDSEYLRSAYLKQQDAPPLGINSRGRLSPVRPMFIAYYTDITAARNGGPENTLMAAEWRAWFPHTIQRGSVTCEGCHDAPARFLFEPASQRIHDLRKDGMGLDSFRLQQGQKLVNGSFMSSAQYLDMTRKTPAYTKAYLQKWKSILNRGAHSSRP